MLRDLWTRLWSWLDTLNDVFDDEDDDAPYCVNGCGRPARVAQPESVIEGALVQDLVCWGCARADD